MNALAFAIIHVSFFFAFALVILKPINYPFIQMRNSGLTKSRFKLWNILVVNYILDMYMKYKEY